MSRYEIQAVRTRASFPHMRTGLRNQERTGIGTYSRKNKRAVADHYAKYISGIQVTSERIGKSYH